MAYSDWSLIGGSGANVDSPAQNALLSNPLLIGGTYCRYFSVNGGGSAWATRGYSAAASYSGGALYNIPNTKAIRIQGYLRVSSISGGSSRSGAWLGAKIDTDFNSNAANNLSSYCFGIRAAGSSTLQISIMLGGAAADLASASFDTWYGLRLEVFPLGTSADRIISYKETFAGSGIWQKMSDTTIQSIAGNFVPWGQNRKNGFFFLQEEQFNGVVSGYADLMDVSVANA